MDARLEKQIAFVLEVDKMKNILRRTLLADGSRRENDAEHSWHLATTAMLLFEYAQEGVDLFRVLKMALVHDLIEIYAGDTFAYDIEGNKDKDKREQAAADRLFGMLPQEQGAELRALWEEFDAMQTPDSCYAAAIDRFQPFLNNTVTEGHTWRLHKVPKAQVLARMDMVRQAVPKLWPFVEASIEDALQKGYIQP